VPEFEVSTVPLIFQQDNAPCHKKGEVLQFLTSTGWEILEWPPRSPDLSPIEWVWNQINMKMKAIHPRPRTRATIRDAILEIWDGLTDYARVKTVETFRQRLKECIKHKGGFTRF
jgi:transposase